LTGISPVTVWNGIQPTVDPAFDLSTNLVPVRKLMFATTPRCGSHFAGSQIYATRQGGLPLEYFNPVHFAAWQTRTGAVTNHATLSQIVRQRTGPNACFAAKLHWPHLQGMLDAGIAGWLTGAVWVRVERLDTLAQAVSWEIATQTGVWVHGQKAWKRPVFQADRITARLGAILYQRHKWDRFFSGAGIVPYILIYENLCADPARNIAPILELLPAAVPRANPWPALPDTRLQSNRRNADWISRYLETLINAPPTQPVGKAALTTQT